MKDFFVSIIIPTRNRKELLAGCLESLFNQSYPAELYEIIVISDGSTDSTAEYLKSLKARPNLKIVYCFPKCGPGASRNIGLKKAKGEIIGFTDDDCILNKDWIKNASIYFKDNSVTGVEGRVFAVTKDFRIGYDFVNNARGGEFKTCNIFYRKTDLDKAGEFDEGFKTFREDSELAFRFLEKGKKIIFAPDCLAKHISSLKNPAVLARRYYYDALLKRKFPEFYDKYIEIAPFGKFMIKKPKQKLYLIYISAVFLSAVTFFVYKPIFFVSFTAAGISYSIIWYFQSKARYVRKFIPKDLLIYSFQLFAAPFVYAFFKFKGAVDFKNKTWDGSL